MSTKVSRVSHFTSQNVDHLEKRCCFLAGLCPYTWRCIVAKQLVGTFLPMGYSPMAGWGWSGRASGIPR